MRVSLRHKCLHVVPWPFAYLFLSKKGLDDAMMILRWNEVVLCFKLPVVVKGQKSGRIPLEKESKSIFF